MDSLESRLTFPLLNSLHLLSVCLILVVIKVITTAVYNAYFHPLRTFPGPKFAACTDLVYLAIAIQGNIHVWTKKLHEQYGDVVRLGPDRVSYISPQAWKEIYGHRVKGKKSNPKDSRSYGPDPSGDRAILTILEDEPHGRLRKVFTHAFSDKALKEQEHLIGGYVDRLISNIRQAAPSNPLFDMVKMYNYTTFDIMGDLCFGESLGLLENSEYSPWVQSIFSSIKAGSLARMVMEYPLLGHLARALMPKSLKEMEKKHFQHSMDRVDKRLAHGADKPDIWNLILNAEEKLSIGEMYANSGLFMVACSETTATSLSGLTYHLLTNPDKLKKLVDEVRAFQTEEELNLNNLPRLPYLSACFQEGLRVYPPVPIGLSREIPDGGNIILGQSLPAKTRISVPQWSAYRSARNFKDPDSFIPERWLPESGFDEDKKDALQPFSIGPRNCIGKNLAFHEMRLILAKILWNFDLDLCPESRSWMDQKCYTLWEKGPLMVKVVPVRQ